MKAVERIILFISLVINTLLLIWVMELSGDLIQNRADLIKFKSDMLQFMQSTTSSIEHHTNAIGAFPVKAYPCIDQHTEPRSGTVVRVTETQTRQYFRVNKEELDYLQSLPACQP
jgi:hypothetical protein